MHKSYILAVGMLALALFSNSNAQTNTGTSGSGSSPATCTPYSVPYGLTQKTVTCPDGSAGMMYQTATRTCPGGTVTISSTYTTVGCTLPQAQSTDCSAGSSTSQSSACAGIDAQAPGCPSGEGWTTGGTPPPGIAPGVAHCAAVCTPSSTTYACPTGYTGTYTAGNTCSGNTSVPFNNQATMCVFNHPTPPSCTPVTNTLACPTGDYPGTYTAGNTCSGSTSIPFNNQSSMCVVLPPTTSFSIKSGLHSTGHAAGLWNGYGSSAGSCVVAYPCTTTLTSLYGYQIEYLTSAVSAMPCAVTYGCYRLTLTLKGTIPLNKILKITVNGISAAPTGSAQYNVGLPTAYTSWWIDAYSTAYPGHGATFPVLSYPQTFSIAIN